MKNIQIIDGADNCEYSIYSVTDEDFETLFGRDGRDVEFISDILERADADRLEALFARL